MDNSVYQPLSHALNPPTTDSRPTYAHPVQLQNAVDHSADHDVHADSHPRHEEEEEYYDGEHREQRPPYRDQTERGRQEGLPSEDDMTW